MKELHIYSKQGMNKTKPHIRRMRKMDGFLIIFSDFCKTLGEILIQLRGLVLVWATELDCVKTRHGLVSTSPTAPAAFKTTSATKQQAHDYKYKNCTPSYLYLSWKLVSAI